MTLVVKAVFLLIATILCVPLARGQTCVAPAGYVYGGTSPFGYTCDGTTVLLTALGNVPVLSFGEQSLIVEQSLSAWCCGDCPEQTLSWDLTSTFRLSTDNVFKAEGCYAYGELHSSTQDTTYYSRECDDYDPITIDCHASPNCGCSFPCDVEYLPTEVGGVIYLEITDGDCGTVSVWSSLSDNANGVGLVFSCPSECESCANTTTCTSCSTGYYLDWSSGQCLPNSDCGELTCGGTDQCCEDVLDGFQCYNPATHACFGSTKLCAKTDAACGTICYNTSLYSCVNGALVQN